MKILVTILIVAVIVAIIYFLFKNNKVKKDNKNAPEKRGPGKDKEKRENL